MIVVAMDVSAEPADGVDEQLAERARAEGLKLTGEGGLMARLTKVVVESALEGEMGDHLGYRKHDPASRHGGRSRKETRSKTLVTEVGLVEIEVPRDRESSFEPVIFIDAVNVKIRDGNVANRPVYVALAVTVEGKRDILGLWAGEHGNGEDAKYWMRVLSEIKNRGTQDCLIVVCDGLKGLPEAIAPVWSQAILQTCLVYLLRNSFRYASKKNWATIAKDLKPCTPHRRSPLRWMPSLNSGRNGRRSIPRSSGCRRTRGRSACRCCGSTRRSA